MVLVPDPIFFPKIVRNQGVRKVAFFIENTSPRDLVVKINELNCPDWLYIDEVKENSSFESIHPGRVLVFPRRCKRRFIANVASGHPFLPEEDSSTDERVTLTTWTATYDSAVEIESIDWELYRDSEDDLDISVTIQSIVSHLEDYRGIFAIDFGTTNTCYAYKTVRVRGRDPRDAHEKPAHASIEIPSVVYYQDVHNRENPKYEVGVTANRLISRNSHEIYAYFMSIKRLLGQGRKFFVLDSQAGRRIENRQEWSAEEIAAFIIRKVMEKAQSELAEQKLGTRITEVVATYPTVFSPRRKRAIRKAFELALKSLNERQGSSDDGKVRLQIDEANAATFNYIAGPMLDSFFEFAKKREETNLLTFDFGGGTIDISLIHVLFEQTEDDRTRIQTRMVGVSGEAFYGGDNVTLAIFQLLKEKLAKAIANSRLSDIAPVEVEEKVADDPWGDDDDLDDWGESSAKKAEPEEPEQDLTAQFAQADVFNDDDRDVGGANAYVDLLKELTDQVDADLVERVIPTRWAQYANSEPHKELLAKKIFYEIWLEAEKLKLLLVNSDADQVSIQAPLERVARFGGIDPKVFNEDVTLTMDELNAAVTDKIVSAIYKAKALVDQGLEEIKEQKPDVEPEADVEEDDDDDEFGVLKKLKAAKAKPKERNYKKSLDQPNFKVLLAGNASSLPVVKQKLLEIFDLDERDLIRPQHLKRSVAQGAAEELFMRRQFGSQGFIHFESQDFLNCLPYSIGLYNRHIGFYPIFKRGSEAGAVVVLNAQECRLIHSELEDLALYADYHDGAGPNYLGWLDFLKPIDQGDVEPSDNFSIEFSLLENREIRARVLSTGKVYDSQEPAEDDLDPVLDPFSGVH